MIMDQDPQMMDGARWRTESGQTIVLFVALLLGLLAFTGLAVDAGFIFARSSQFSSAVDAAALAGVVEMDPTAPTLTEADARAQQFLAANGWPTASMTFVSTSTLTIQGFPEYTITVTWPVETYFMRVLGFRTVSVSHAATAVHVAQAEIFTPTFFEYGHMRKAAQFIMGPDSCTTHGDPISSNYGTAAGVPNTDLTHFNDSIRYRIRVPVETYTMTNRLRVELFDADSANYNQNVGASVIYSNYYRQIPDNGDPDGNGVVERSCATDSISGGANGQQCVFRIEERNTLERFNSNPLWFVRVDETYDSNCNPAPDDPSGNTVTEFRLYYLDADGVEREIAKYVESNHALTSTDMRWYSPPGFEFALDPVPVVEGSRYVYLHVKALAGSAKNVWDLWAGPPSTAALLHPDVNMRNLIIANHPTSFPSGGVQIFALGRMPLQHFTREPATIPLVPIPSSLAGGTIYASVFDYEGQWPLNFTIDTVPTNTFYENIGLTTAPDPDPLQIPRLVTCGPENNCNAKWTDPQVRLGIPSTFFYGGTLFGTLNPATNSGGSDAQTWMLSATAGRPFLTR
jgi:Flp pilus assembly protein TadG